jgi:hypothetical protein
MKGLATAVLTAALAAAVLTAPAHSTVTSNWYWTPGFCKSELQNYGVQTGDGRTYNVSKAFCVGLHNHCWLDRGLPRYKVFITVARSYDGVVRRMQLTVTGRNSWRGSPLRIIEPYMSAADFNAAYGPAAWTVAMNENAACCWDAHP